MAAQCPGCGWDTLCRSTHDYYHVQTNLGCPVLREKYDYRLVDTPSDWRDPHHGLPRPGVWSLWRRAKGSHDEWCWQAYI